MMHAGNSPASRDKAYFLHPFTNMRAHEQIGPMVIERGEGVYVYDENGKAYLEGVGGLWATNLGFDNERLVQAAVKQMRTLPFYHTFTHKSHNPAIDLSEKLIQMAPVPMSKVFFCSSGSEANDTAVKMIWFYNNALGRPQKKKIIARLNAYHGVTVVSASLTGLPHLHKHFDLPLPQILHTDLPHYYRFHHDGETEEQFAQRMADNLEALILKEGPDTIAAFFAEPMQGVGGVILPPKTYFERIQAVLKKYDILLVADEVVSGFGRTGNMWGTETFGMQPDMIVCAKALSACFVPISAVMISEKVYQTLAPLSEQAGTFGHGFTHSANPIMAAVALETLKIYDEMDIVGRVRQIGPRLQENVRKLLDHPLVGDARGVGLVAGLELVKDKATRTPFDPALKVGPMVFARLQEKGIILRATGGDIIAFSPAMIITEEQIDSIFPPLRQSLDEVYAKLQADGVIPAAA